MEDYLFIYGELTVRRHFGLFCFVFNNTTTQKSPEFVEGFVDKRERKEQGSGKRLWLNLKQNSQKLTKSPPSNQRVINLKLCTEQRPPLSPTASLANWKLVIRIC